MLALQYFRNNQIEPVLEEIIRFTRTVTKFKYLTINFQEIYRIYMPKCKTAQESIWKSLNKLLCTLIHLYKKGDDIVISFLNYSVG